MPFDIRDSNKDLGSDREKGNIDDKTIPSLNLNIFMTSSMSLFGKGSLLSIRSPYKILLTFSK